MKGVRTICSTCGGKTRREEISFTAERHGVTVTMEGVPAMVCQQCGEQYIPGPIAMDTGDAFREAVRALEELANRWWSENAKSNRKNSRWQPFKAITVSVSKASCQKAKKQPVRQAVPVEGQRR